MTDRILMFGGIFLFVLLLTQVFTAPITSTSAQSRRRLRQRIAQLANEVVVAEQISLARHTYLQGLRPFERWLESWPALAPLVRLIEQAGIQIPAYRIVLISLGGALVALVLAPLFTTRDILILAMTVLASLGPWIWLKRQKAQRLISFEASLPDALSMLARTLRAGLPLSQALQIVSQEMQGPVAKEFGIVFNELNYGGNLRAAFLAMLERIPSVAVMAMAVAIMIQRETGGNLAESVDRLERLMRERFRFQRHLRTLTASNRTSAWIVGLIPFILAAAMELLSPGYLATLMDHPTGIKLFYAALGLQAVGGLVIWRMIQLDI
jgi:tight adherence protein B